MEIMESPNEGEAPIEILTDDALEHVFQFIHPKDHINLALVCSWWAEILLSPHSLIPKTIVMPFKAYPDSKLKAVLESLLPVEIVCGVLPISREALQIVSSSLKTFSFNHKAATRNEFPRGQNNLRTWGPRQILDLRILVNLTNLDLSRMVLMRDNEMKALHSFPRLVTLNLSRCLHITDKGLEDIQVLTKIASLELSFCGITGMGFQHLDVLTTLKNLSLKGCKKLTAEVWGLLFDMGISKIARVSSLRDLDLSECGECLNVESLAHLQRLRLIHLNLNSNSTISNEDAAVLGTLTSLESLHIYGSSTISDLGLSHLAVLTRLTILDLSKCQRITDLGLQALQSLTALIKLDVKRVHYTPSEITQEGLDELQQHLPNCKISNEKMPLVTSFGLHLY